MVRVGGDFGYSPPSPRNLLLVAGGLGINPLLSILLHHSWLVGRRGQEEEEEEAKRVKLLYSAKTVKELIFKVFLYSFFHTRNLHFPTLPPSLPPFQDEIDALCSKCQWLSVNYFVTREDTSLPATACEPRPQQALSASSAAVPCIAGPPSLPPSPQAEDWVAKT